MTIEANQNGTCVVLKVAGRMDAGNAQVFEEACTKWVEQGIDKMIVDLSALTYVSSMGLRSFIVAGKLLQSKNGTFRLCCVTGLVKQVFEITRLNSIFQMHDTLDAALAAV